MPNPDKLMIFLTLWILIRMSKKLIIAGGGTGGHIFPAIAIANAVKLKQPNYDILFVGAKGKMEMDKVPKEGYRIIGLDIAGMNRSSLIKNIFLPFKLLKSFMQARKVLNEYNPHAVVGVGGYASFPVLYWAQKRKIPTLIQEQNSFAGKSNKILGRMADVICVAYDGMERFFPKQKIVFTGNPVRKNIAQPSSKTEALSFFQLNANQKTVFAFGGSLGAKSINESLRSNFKDILNTGAQLIWQTGTPFYAIAKEAVEGYESQVKVYEFIREMDLAYAAADVIIARAGASSISELARIGKPVVFVPFPFASEDHQTHNAMSLVQKSAARLVPDGEAKETLVSTIIHLLKNEEESRNLSQHLKPLGIANADDRIADLLIKIMNT